jgi:hypothetical protein
MQTSSKVYNFEAQSVVDKSFEQPLSPGVKFSNINDEFHDSDKDEDEDEMFTSTVRGNGDNEDLFSVTEGKSCYSSGYLKEILDKCVSRGVCDKHKEDFMELISKLERSEDVYIGDICTSPDRRLWWNKSTPLMIACLEGSRTLVRLLLLMGADVRKTNELGSTGKCKLLLAYMCCNASVHVKEVTDVLV